MSLTLPGYYQEAPGSPKYHDATQDGSHDSNHDTFTDFVTLVCQEAQQTQVGW